MIAACFALSLRDDLLSNVRKESLSEGFARVVGSSDSRGVSPLAQQLWALRDAGTSFAEMERVADRQGYRISVSTISDADEYVNGEGFTTNQAEAYFGQLKRSIDGTHHAVSREHLHRYLAQHDFLRSTFKMDDSDRMRLLVDNTAGRRLTYKPLTAEG